MEHNEGSKYLAAILISTLPIALMIPVSIYRKRERMVKAIHYLTYYAIGALTAELFSHLFPEIFEEDNGTYGLVMGVGLLSFMWLDTIISSQESHVLIYFLGDALHNLCDGLVIGSTYTHNESLGFITAISIAVHEISHEVADFVVYFKNNQKFSKIIIMELTSGLAMVAGVAFESLFSSFHMYIMAFASGALLFTLFGIYNSVKENEDGKTSNSHSVWEFGCLILGFVVISSIKE
jgi:zinc transporter ZupT